MSMNIQGPNFGTYDAGYLQAVQREMARSVKSNILKEIGDPEEQIALALQGDPEDIVYLSPEAKAYLKKLRRKLMKRAEGDVLDEEDEDEAPKEKDFNELLNDIDTFRKQSGDSEAKETPKNFIFPSVIQLSAFVPGAAHRPSPSAAYTPPSSPVRDKINRMIYYAPSEAARLKTQDELEPMGFTVVSMLRDFGTHIIVLERNKALTQLKINNMYVVAPSEKTFDGRPWSRVRGLYDNARRLLVIGEEQLGVEGHSCARHEFAHAYDNAFSQNHGRRLPLSVQLWNKFRANRTGLISAYAATNPAEYFAESVEAFFQPALKAILRQRDPDMYAYLEDLFRS